MFYISVKPIRSDHTLSIQENSKTKLIFVRVKKKISFHVVYIAVMEIVLRVTLFLIKWSKWNRIKPLWEIKKKVP